LGYPTLLPRSTDEKLTPPRSHCKTPFARLLSFCSQYFVVMAPKRRRDVVAKEIPMTYTFRRSLIDGGDISSLQKSVQ
jgi:hypothetical protein